MIVTGRNVQSKLKTVLCKSPKKIVFLKTGKAGPQSTNTHLNKIKSEHRAVIV